MRCKYSIWPKNVKEIDIYIPTCWAPQAKKKERECRSGGSTKHRKGEIAIKIPEISFYIYLIEEKTIFTCKGEFTPLAMEKDFKGFTIGRPVCLVAGAPFPIGKVKPVGLVSVCLFVCVGVFDTWRVLYVLLARGKSISANFKLEILLFSAVHLLRCVA